MNRPLDLQKKELRKILKEKRNALDPDTCRSSDTAIFKAITSWDVYQKAETVFCFVGTEDEINTRPVLENTEFWSQKKAVKKSHRKPSIWH